MSGVPIRITHPRWHFCLVWTALVGSSLLYCELSGAVHGEATVHWRTSASWLLQVWPGWLLLSLLALGSAAARWVRRFGAPALAVAGVAVCGCALISEWLLNRAFSTWGGLERWDSFWVIAYERAPYCLVGAGVLLALTRHRARATTASSAPVREELRRTPQTIAIQGRTGLVTIEVACLEALISAENYVTLCLQDGHTHLHRATLTGFAAGLGNMVRIHRSIFINPRHVRRLLPGHRVQLTSGRVVTVGRSYRATTATLARYAISDTGGSTH